MPSMITGIIGGIQGASAAHNAANDLSGGYNKAGQTVIDAAAQVNPGITAAAAQGAGNVINQGQLAGQQVVSAAGTAANNATAAANAGIAGLSPYATNGATASNALATDLQAGGQLNTPFNAQMMAATSPGYQFQLQQGQSGLARSMAAAGLSGSGGAMKAAMQYNQNYAGTAYNNAFNQYTTQNQNLFNNLNSQAQQGQQASTTQAGLGVNAAQYGGTINTNAAQYAGTTGVGTQEYGAGMMYGAANTTAQNTLSANNYLANTQVEAARAQGQGDINAANAWNGALGSIGNAGNALMTGGASMFSSAFGGGGGGGGGSVAPSSYGMPSMASNTGYTYGGQPGYSYGAEMPPMTNVGPAPSLGPYY